jgi:hypothetical protein
MTLSVDPIADASGPEQLQMNPSGIAGPASFVVGAELALLDELELGELEPQALRIPATRAHASMYLKRIRTSPPSKASVTGRALRGLAAGRNC